MVRCTARNRSGLAKAGRLVVLVCCDREVRERQETHGIARPFKRIAQAGHLTPDTTTLRLTSASAWFARLMQATQLHRQFCRIARFCRMTVPRENDLDIAHSPSMDLSKSLDLERRKLTA